MLWYYVIGFGPAWVLGAAGAVLVWATGRRTGEQEVPLAASVLACMGLASPVVLFLN